jgi:predicted MFS family arabinose efflux permease
VRHAFRALRTRNYRLYFGGQLVSLVGTWMHIVAQSWLVLRLSGSGFAVGIATALQFGPMLVGGVWGGLIADRLPKRRILLVTQSLFAVEALALGVLVASGSIELWMVYGFALAYGVIQVVDVPARQSFVPEMVGDDDVMNAVSLNSAVFNAARMAGPAIAGVMIAGVSIAVCFFANAASFVTVLGALALMREKELRIHPERAQKGRGQIRAGLRYVASDPDLLLPILLMGVVSTLGLNFQIVLPVLARFTFNGDAKTFGALSAVFAFGSLIGSMYAATRRKPSRKLLVGTALAFGALEIVAALAPTLQTAYIALPLVGVAGMLFIATANSTLQLKASPIMRGRVLALFSLVLLGSTPIGGPVIGWISQEFSPRAALAVGGAATLMATTVIGAYLLGRQRGEAAATRAYEAPLPESVLAGAEAS